MSGRIPLRCLTIDVTGTLMRYKLHIGDIYCISAKKVGQPCPNYESMYRAYKHAYEVLSGKYPCFGAFETDPPMDTRTWWKNCVRLSFQESGYDYGEDETFDRIFNRIYALFGSREPYEVFSDAPHFLEWLRDDNALKLGVITNASERYRDTILPILDLDFYFDFIVSSRDAKAKKPHSHMFEYASQKGTFEMNESWLHIGDNKVKDYDCVKALGGNAILLNRFGRADLQEARTKGVTVLDSLGEARAWIESNYILGEENIQ